MSIDVAQFPDTDVQTVMERPVAWEPRQAATFRARPELMTEAQQADAMARHACRVNRNEASSEPCPFLRAGIHASCETCLNLLEKEGHALPFQYPAASPPPIH